MPALAGEVALESGDKLLWQYQGHQWRLTVAIASYQGRDDATRKQRHAYIAEYYGRWFDFTPVTGLPGTDPGTPIPVKGAASSTASTQTPLEVRPSTAVTAPHRLTSRATSVIGAACP